MAKKKRGMKVGQSRIGVRRLNGVRTRVKITKKSGGRESVHKIGAKSTKKKRRR